MSALAVLARFRGRGVGTALLEEARGEARAAGRYLIAATADERLARLFRPAGAYVPTSAAASR